MCQVMSSPYAAELQHSDDPSLDLEGLWERAHHIAQFVSAQKLNSLIWQRVLCHREEIYLQFLKFQ